MRCREEATSRCWHLHFSVFSHAGRATCFLFSFSSRHRSFPGSSKPCAVVDGLDRGIVQKKAEEAGGKRERENEHLVESEEYERDD